MSTTLSCPSLSQEGAARLQALLEQQTLSRRIPSAFLTVVSPTNVLFSGAAGKFDPLEAGSRQVDVEDVMWFASTTKLLTSVCYLQLVDQGVLSLSSELGTLYPPLAEASRRIFGGVDEEGQPIWTDNPTPITLGMMLNQSSGFGGEFGDKVQAWKKYVAATAAARGGKAKGTGFVNSCKVDNLIHTPITFEPGSWYEYGNSAEWLALILPTLVPEETFEEYLQAHVCQPLGLENTTFYPFEGKRKDRLLPCRYGEGAQERSDGQYEWKPLEEVQGMLAEGLCLPRRRSDIEYPAGGGGIYSSTRDYGTLLQHLLAHYLSLSDPSVPSPKQPLLSDASVTSLFSRSLDPRAHPPMAANLNRIRGFTGSDTLRPGEADWTTGMALYAPQGEGRRRGGMGRLAGSVGWGGAAGTEYWIDPLSKIAAVWTTQMLPVAAPVVAESKLEVELLIYEVLGL